jgi:hypothetical protein
MHVLGSLGETKVALMATDVARPLDGLCEGGLLPLNLPQADHVRLTYKFPCGSYMSSEAWEKLKKWTGQPMLQKSRHTNYVRPPCLFQSNLT